MDLCAAAQAAGIPEERALRLTLSQLKRRIAAHRWLLATRRQEQILDLRAAMSDDPQHVTERIARIFAELEPE